MARIPKHFIHNTVIELTFRVEEGLPFVSTSFMRLILQSYLARAQQLYRVDIVALMVMGNHIHLIIVVYDPEAVSRFVGYFKRETALAVNSLLGRSKHTVWAEGYGSPIVLDEEKLLQRLVYFYTNPQRARLVNAIEEYPQISSWSAFLSGGSVSRKIPCFPRTAVPALDSVVEKVARAVHAAILSEKNGVAVLEINPFAWTQCFPDSSRLTPEILVAEVTKQVRAIEDAIRREKGDSVLGVEALVHQDIRKPHRPKKQGKNMICLGSDRVKRQDYIAWFLEEAKRARDGIRDWLQMNTSLSLPPGFFAPGGKLYSNVCPHFLYS